jgi:hypothetical protein
MYVRKTQTLVNDIEYEVDRMRNNALHQLKEDIKIEIGTPLHASMQSMIETALWHEAPDLKDRMPIQWCSMENQCSVTFEEEGKKVVRVDVETTDSNKFKMPPKHSRWNTFPIHEQYWLPLVREWLTTRQAAAIKHEEIMESFGDIARQLTGFMGKHSSLNTALKEMPELKLYVPDHYIEKLEKQENRIKAKPKAPTTDDDVEVDIEALTRAAVAHRLTKGNS